MGQFSEGAKEATAGCTHDSISRREFISGSAAVIAAVVFDRTAPAKAVANDVGQVSSGAFENARERASAIVNQMTLDEVAGQLVNSAPALPRLGLQKYQYWTEALHGMAVDGPITSFPQPIALGCSWNPELVDRVYSAVSDEARACHNQKGYGLTFFSPATVNMGLRDPRWGRVWENFSEDPLLVQTFGVHVTRAMQGDHPQYLKTIACAKHFICNETDSDRDYADAAPDRRSFWEYYVRGFEACVREGQVFSVMSAYNSLWGIPCSASPFLLTDILRNRWGFKGYVVSDCDAIRDIYQTHHYVETPHEAAALAIKAGSDLNCGKTYSESLMKAVQEKLVTEEAIRNALARVLTGRVLLGEFDAPDAVPWSGLTAEILEGKGHRNLAREAACQSLVLLKNKDHLLPLDKGNLKRIAVIGPMAGACHLGGYSGRPTYLVSPYAGISVALGESPFHGKIMAGQYLSTSNYRGPIAAYTHDGTEYLTSIVNNSWAQYGPIDFMGKTAIEFQYAAESEGGIDVHLDDRSNAPLVSLEITASRSMFDWQTVSCPIPATTGSHIVFLRFRSANRQPFFNLTSFQLTPSGPPTESATRVVFAPGCTIVGPRNQALLDTAVKEATSSDVVILFLGVNRLLSDEGHDRWSLDLPDVQHELAEAILAANQRTVVVINTTCPVSFELESQKAAAILCSLFAGERQGDAIADAIFGDYNPGGKLCSTWYRDVSQLPNFHDYDIKHGRTYMYFEGEPLYAFGHGLSYTNFAYKNLHVDADRLVPEHTIQVTAEITNTGTVPGDEVVQFYVKADGKIQRPKLQLAGFRRVPLRPGESQTVAFSLPHDHIALRYWDEAKNGYEYDTGDVELLIGSSSIDIRLRGSIMLA
ncbi:MAG: glycoside hydrolase family 3 C-terminal domain-containing protein [Terracidiphilus sp.]